MTTQYTPILKLALPVTGELSGTWGDVVNDNITSMIEQAIAGLSTISTWSANSHTLTTANGTTSESRCAMLVAQNGAGLAAAGEIVCPASSKLYVLKNDTSYAITLKTSGGTGVAVASGNTAFLFCDGTNVNACVTTIVDGRVTGNLTVDGNATINGNTTLGNATSDTITATARFASGLTPSADNTYDLGSSGNSWKDVYIDGTAYLALVDINGGTIDGVSIGASTPATIINVDNLRLDGNTLSSTDTNGNVVIAPNGTGDVQLDADTVRVGDSGAAATLTSNGAGALTVTTGGAANLVLSTNSGTDSGTITINNGTNANIVLAPNGTGDVQLDADTVRVGDANTDVTLTSNGTGNLNLSTNGGTNSGTIQIAQGANGNITLTPNGTGSVSVPKLVWSNGTSGRVPYLTTGGQFTDDADMTFDGTTLTVNGLTVSGTPTFSGGTANGVVYLNGSKQATTGTALAFSGTQLSVTTTSDTSALVRTTGTANAAALILQTGDGTTSGKYAYARFVNDDATTVDWRLGTYGTNTLNLHNATSGNTLLGIDTGGAFTLNPQANGHAVFNEGGVDADFRVESDTETHMLFVDAGNNRVGVATSAPTQTLGVSGTFQVSRPFSSGITVGRFYNSASTSGAQVYDVVHAMSDDAPAIRISEYDSGSAAIVGELTLSGGDANVQVLGGTGTVILSSNRAVGAAGYIQTGERIRLDSTGVVINDTGADLDFRVESDTNTHALFVDAGSNTIGLFSSSPTSSLSVGNNKAFVWNNTGIENVATALIGERNTTNNSNAFAVAGTTHNAYYPASFVIDSEYGNYGASATTFNLTSYGVKYLGWSGNMRLNVSSSTSTYNMLFLSDSSVVVNESGLDADFRVESNDSTHALFVDAGNNRVGILDNGPISALTIGNFSNSNFGITNFSRDRSSRFHYFAGSSGGATKTVTVDIADFGLCGQVVTIDVSGQKYNSGLSNFYVRYVYALMEESGASRINQNLSTQLGFSLGNQTAQVGAVTVTFPSGGATRLTFTVGGEYDTRVWIKAEGAAQNGVTSISVA